eukprot:GHVT01104266.1.p1 GENE.GHVT01104266.1~~GHVT01104266.1.p1  ORF type:complete len:129 (-),score=0.17 GHVT01104266.1:1162-1548(-)
MGLPGGKGCGFVQSKIGRQVVLYLAAWTLMILQLEATDPPKDLLTHLKANLRDVTVKAIKKPSYEIKINVMHKQVLDAVRNGNEKLGVHILSAFFSRFKVPPQTMLSLPLNCKFWKSWTFISSQIIAC